MKNRISKFRGWDISQKEWINPARIEIYSSDGILQDLYDPEGTDVIIQQFTGLTDLTNKEIFEGDICNLYIYSRRISGVRPVIELGDIRFHKHGFCFFSKETDGEYIGSLISGVRDGFEIVGNILENPELLKK
jgi:uncharacterized phage protein (TIGR01671 family)